MNVQELLQAHWLTQTEVEQLLQQYQFALTRNMHSAVRQYNAADPIAAQFFPDKREQDINPNELNDPIGDDPHSPLPGLVHRYPNRVLWKVTPVCAVYCRFCFRKEHIGRKGTALKQSDIAAVAAYLSEHQEVSEVIFSGGDPLTLSVRKLAQLSAVFAELPHIRRLRIHTRIPVVLPEKIESALLEWLNTVPQSVHIVIHANHVNELTALAKIALNKLYRHGVMLYSQTVLLKGVNDSADTLAELMNAFLDNGVKPYYLHHLDLARGTGHFRLSLHEGLMIEQELRNRLSGIAMPTYIVEIPGGGGKIPVRHLTEKQYQILNDFGIF